MKNPDIRKTIILGISLCLPCASSAIQVVAGPITVVHNGPVTDFSARDFSSTHDYTALLTEWKAFAQSATIALDYIVDPSFDYAPDAYLSASIGFRFDIQTPTNVEVRFSQWQLNTITSVIDLQSMEQLDSLKRTHTGASPQAAFAGVSYNYTPGSEIRSLRLSISYEFLPGKGLLPSPDPACESFSCMPPFKDNLSLVEARSQIIFAPVPEPSTCALALLGVFALGAMARREQKVTQARRTQS